MSPRHLVIAAALAAACASPRASVPPPASPRTPMDLAAIPIEPPPGMRTYYLALLRRGPAWTAEETEDSRRLGEGHMANIERLAREGTLVLAGPFLDSEGSSDLAGIFVLAVDSLAAARAALDQDPAVKAGRFAVELRAWMAGDGIRTVMELPPPAKLEPQLRCRNSERHRQFDFWLGEWEVQLPDGKRAGRNRIEKGQHGCVVRELWTGAGGGTGQSINYVDPDSQQWVQLWTDSTGGVIELRGGLEGKAMVLSGEHREPGKPSRKMRGSWTPLDGGRVRQHIEESADGGATFATWFDGIYVPVGR